MLFRISDFGFRIGDGGLGSIMERPLFANSEESATIRKKQDTAWTRFCKHKLALGGGVCVLLLIGSVLSAPWISPRDPLYADVQYRFTAPFNHGFLLGTDEIGRDMLSRLLHAGRISLAVGFTAMLVSIVVGTTIGALAGYYRSWLDFLLMRFTDVMLAFPSIFLILALSAFLAASVTSIILIIGLTAWMEVARIVRGQILSLREQDFILASRAVGVPDSRIILHHLLPNCLAPILVAATLHVAQAVLLESYISYLGYGIQPPRASWGNMLNNAQSYFTTAPWVAILPGLMITLTVTSFNFMGDGLRDALDPRLRGE
jgi:peptide/nickel transport system permease protein